MILVDSSVWIDLLRGSADPSVRDLVRQRADELATTGPIVMEVLAGSRQHDLHDQLLTALVQRAIEPELDYRHAAAVCRAVRKAGYTVRSLNDCLIAAIALRFGDEVAHRDEDFSRIAEVTELRQLRV